MSAVEQQLSETEGIRIGARLLSEHKVDKAHVRATGFTATGQESCDLGHVRRQKLVCDGQRLRSDVVLPLG